MTAAADQTAPAIAGVPWWRETSQRDGDGRPWPWWIPDEAPAGLGHSVLWIDEAALDMYARGDAEPAVTVQRGPGGSLIGAILRFSGYPGLEKAACYRIVTRSHSSANRQRPYYVAVWPD